MKRRNSNKWALPVAFGAILVIAVADRDLHDLGQDDAPDDAVAVVDGEAVSREAFDSALAQAATQQGLGCRLPRTTPCTRRSPSRP